MDDLSEGKHSQRDHDSASGSLLRSVHKDYREFAAFKHSRRSSLSDPKILKKHEELEKYRKRGSVQRSLSYPVDLSGRVGCASEQSERSENQDVAFYFTNHQGVFVAGVFDGHGKNGKIAAEKAAQLFKEKLGVFQLVESMSMEKVDSPQEYFEKYKLRLVKL